MELSLILISIVNFVNLLKKGKQTKSDSQDSHVISSPPMETIPPEILFIVFSHLSFDRHWCSARRVCKEWNEICFVTADPRASNFLLFRHALFSSNTKLLQKLLVHPKVSLNEILFQLRNIILCNMNYISLEILQEILQQCIITPPEALLSVCGIDRIDLFRDLIDSHNVNPGGEENTFLKRVIMSNNTNILRELLKDDRVDPSVNQSECLIEACKLGHEEVVRILLEDSRVNASTQQDCCLGIASEQGYLEIVRLLLRHGADPSGGDNYAIRWASSMGRSEVVKELLKDFRTEPSALDNFAIRAAQRNSRQGIVFILLRDSRLRIPDTF